MTPFNAHNLRRVTPWVTSEDEDLDHFLNTNVVSDGLPDADQKFNVYEPDSLYASAGEFHRRMNAAQDQNPNASEPSHDLWSRIEKKYAQQVKESEMSSIPIMLDNRPSRVQPAPPAPPHVKRRRSDISRWTNAIAAAVLIVAIGAGYWFSGYGPGGSGQGGDSPRYAALGVTPAASPETSTVGCDVDPLTTDEVMAIVRNPLNLLNHMGVALAASPQPLLELKANEIFPLPGNEYETSVPSEEEFASMKATTDAYYSCSQSGSHFQVWALTAPDVVQTKILDHFPVFRDESTIRQWIQTVGPEPYVRAAEGFDPYAGFANESYRIESNPDRIESVIVEAQRPQDPKTAWIGTHVVRENDGKTISLTGARPSSVLKVGEQAEVLILVQFPGTDVWFVTGTSPIRGE